MFSTSNAWGKLIGPSEHHYSYYWLLQTVYRVAHAHPARVRPSVTAYAQCFDTVNSLASGQRADPTGSRRPYGIVW